MDSWSKDFQNMNTNDKILRLATAGGLAVLLLVVVLRSFSAGPGDSAQMAQTDSADEAEAASAEPEAPAATEAAEADTTETAESDTTEMAEADTTEAAETDTTETAAAENTAAETEAQSESADAGQTTDSAADPEASETETASAEPTEATGGDATAGTAQTAGADTAEDAAEAQEYAMLASADIDNGESVFRQCAACHNYDAEQNMGGPHLVNIVGREVAAVDDWRYSTALQEHGGVWTPENLNQWIENPDDYIPGNQMAYPGVRNDQDRIDLIGFLYDAQQ